MHIVLNWAGEYLPGVTLTDAATAARLAALWGAKTSEIEQVRTIHLDKRQFFIACVEYISHEHVRVLVGETKKQFELPLRKDATLGTFFVVFAGPEGMRWATMHDFGGEREDLMSAVTVDEKAFTTGSWREGIEWHEVVFDIDNAAISHRPDLWGQWGCAREIAALLEVPFVTKDAPVEFSVVKAKTSSKTIFKAQGSAGCLEVDTATAAKKVLSTRIKGLEQRASDVFYAVRLARVGARAKDMLVDATNIALYTTGHPMHAFDATHVKNGYLEVRLARKGERLVLLDGSEIELTSFDTVFTDGTKVLSLAGIMGGRTSGVAHDTHEVIVESAWYEPGMLRRSALSHKLRTEASARYEKSLDPQGCERSLWCFVRVLERLGQRVKLEPMLEVNVLDESMRTISLAHGRVEDAWGSALDSGVVRDILQRLGFVATYNASTKVYQVEIPSLRVAKDIALDVDLIEEILRIYGYDKVAPKLPVHTMSGHSILKQTRVRELKNLCAYGCAMHEVCTYALLDEQFATRIGYTSSHTPRITNPFSAQYATTISSLVPNLLKACEHNYLEAHDLSFFEVARAWWLEGSSVDEHEVFACARYAHDSASLFYTSKQKIELMSNALKVSLEWKAYTKDASVPAWITHVCDQMCDLGATALLWHQDACVGYAGMIKSAVRETLMPVGGLWACEILLKPLVEDAQPMRFAPSSKYQHVDLDISMFVPYTLETTFLEELVRRVDPRIISVGLVDYFEKDTWTDKRALTLRYRLQDQTATLDGSTITKIQEKVHQVMLAQGVEVR